MKIGITTNGDTLDTRVMTDFETSPYCLIVETDDLSVYVYSNEEISAGSGLAMAEEVINHGCEAIITGSIQQPAFDKLATACITRYFGENFPAQDALDLMEAYQLELIRDYDGADPRNHQHHESCDCGLE